MRPRPPSPAPLVLALALVAAVLGGCTEDGPPTAPTPPAAVATARVGGQPPDGWRTEWFRTVAVDVPDDWGWSQGPLRSAGELVRCSGGGDDAAYVGRPVPASDLCMLLEHEQAEEPEHPSLWFDAPLDPGAEDLGGGWVRETVVVDGVGLTVTSDDPELRAQVLSSVRRQEDCPPDLSTRLPDRFDTTTEGPGTLLTAVVCGYRVLDDGRDAVPVLAYATVPDEADVRAVWERREQAQDCLVEPTLTTDVVVVQTTTRDDFGAPGATPLTQRVVGLVACPQARSVVAPVVDAGLRATLGTYIGPMG